jgi:hypothetical protein
MYEFGATLSPPFADKWFPAHRLACAAGLAPARDDLREGTPANRRPTSTRTHQAARQRVVGSRTVGELPNELA